ncbi:MAG: DNA-directed RNA polymerase subunit beta' [Candidatus Colwellbacteria bacterium]|nr:DNA-directed RNA polymerase subunit beta' [Candidatus Colwellbacteria bacterium]
MKKLAMNREPDFNALMVKIASPEDILNWSYGEVTKPETINYRTQRPEKDGLFSERIFGPTRDWECYCGKYRKIRYKGVICDKCGVEVTRSAVRRERMGHITLATPVVHTWFLRTVPSIISLVLDAPVKQLENVVHYLAYIVTEVDEEKRKTALDEVGREFKTRKGKGDESQGELASAVTEARNFLLGLKPGKVLSERQFADYGRRFGNVFTVSAGGEGVRRVLLGMRLERVVKEINAELEGTKDATRTRKILRRLKVVQSMLDAGIRPEWMIMTVLPILPPDLRPMVALDGGRYATSDLNDLYRRVINRNNRLKKLLELKAPDVIVINEKRMLQEAVDALIDNSRVRQVARTRRPLRSLADMLKGKQGRFRQNLLGKRVDYSGRSVIVVGPHLRLDECGLPKRMALELFRPFVIHEVVEQGLAHNIKMANRLIDQAPPEVWAILEEIIADRKVLLNRAPTLHRLSIQAFKPLLIEDLAIQIPPFVCTAFNADFDGDQMAVHLPLSDEAQREAAEVMLSSFNLLKPASGEAIAVPTRDIILGAYYLTRVLPETQGTGRSFVAPEEVKLAYENEGLHLNALIKLRDMETTCGRIILNEALPEDFGFYNNILTKKSLTGLMAELISRYGMERMRDILDHLKEVSLSYVTLSGLSFSIDDLVAPEEKESVIKEAETRVALIRGQYEEGLLTEEERKERTVETWLEAANRVNEVIPERLGQDNPIYIIIESGSRGTWSQPSQMGGMRGLVTNPKGENIELPIRSSLKEGHTSLEYFISTHGSRKGLVDTALRTAQAGYLTRRLADTSQDVVVKEENCGTKRSIELYREDGESYGGSFVDRLFSRTAAKDLKIGRKTIVKTGEIINREAALLIEKSSLESVAVRSPITCQTLYGVCAKCYGMDLGRNEPIRVGEAVGIIAAQSIGELGTQLTLRTFHTGGLAGRDITTGLPRVEELFEARLPKQEGLMAEAEGKVQKIEEEGSMRRIILRKKAATGKKAKDIIYTTPVSIGVLVKEGDKVFSGDQLTEGNLDPKEILRLRGKEEAARYLVKEIQQIYRSEGATVHDKHMEIVIRQMFGRVRITSVGDSKFVLGEVIDKSRFREVNREIKGAGGEPAKAEELLLGITRAALSADGFLAAASFQETARVLVKAASEGRVDHLRGLKENVILGRLIPIGTALHYGVEEEEELAETKEEEKVELA